MKTIHNLLFEVAPFELNIDKERPWMKFRVGTCEGLWRTTKTSYDILAIINTNPGNGHLNDLLQWFEYSCKRDKRSLKVLEIWNSRLKKHLIEKRGFLELQNDTVIKQF